MIKVTYGTGNAISATRGPQIIQLLTEDLADELATDAMQIADEETPVGATGNLKDSTKRTEKKISGAGLIVINEVTWTAKHAEPVDRGSKAHWAPIGPLTLWASVKLGNPDAAWRLQRSIARRGTVANNFLPRTFARVKGKVNAVVANFRQRFVNGLGG